MNEPFHETRHKVAERWSLVTDEVTGESYVLREIIPGATLTGTPYVQNTHRVEVGAFLIGDYDSKAKRKLQLLLDKKKKTSRS